VVSDKIGALLKSSNVDVRAMMENVYYYSAGKNEDVHGFYRYSDDIAGKFYPAQMRSFFLLFRLTVDRLSRLFKKVFTPFLKGVCFMEHLTSSCLKIPKLERRSRVFDRDSLYNYRFNHI
jgi:hypothetical protein